MGKKISELIKELPNGAEISAELLNMLHDGSSVQDILDYSYDVLGNPLMLVDMTFNYEASAGTEHLDDEPVWEYTVKNGFIPNYYLNHIADVENQEQEDSLFMEEQVGTILNHGQFTVRIFRGARLLGYIMLLQKDHLIVTEERTYLQLLAGVLSIRMTSRQENDDFRFSVIENFLTSILRNKIDSPEEIRSRQELFGIRLYDIMHVITIEMMDFRAGEEKKYNLLKKIRKLFDRNNVIQMNDYIIVLYDTKKTEEALNEELKIQLRLILEKYHCVANVSYPFGDLSDFYRYYMQTVYCMELRDLLEVSDLIMYYEDYIEYHMLTNFKEQIDLNLLLNDAVKELQQMDQENDSDYTNTLFTYVNCQQNIARSAERLQVHYNTLKYRLNRIVSLTGIDLNDEKVVFSVMISERILKIQSMLSEPIRIQGTYDNDWLNHANPPGSHGTRQKLNKQRSLFSR